MKYIKKTSNIISISILISQFLILSCAKPLVDGKTYAMEPVSRVIPADPNTIYYAVRWAFDECGYPIGPEDLASGVIESKWVPTAAGSHYVDIFDGRDYGASASYYKMVVRIVPQDVGSSRVEARTDVKAFVNGMRSTGDKERAILEKIAEYARGNSINVTNLGVEE